MNIFYLHEDPQICAQYHCNKHVVKMIMEYAQIMCTNKRLLDKELLTTEEEKLLLKSTHINHPSVKWCGESKDNYIWLYNLFIQLLEEYTYRYGKYHKYESLKDILSNAPHNISVNVGFFSPYLAMPEECKTSCPIHSYHNYYRMKKQHICQWKSRPIPDFFTRN